MGDSVRQFKIPDPEDSGSGKLKTESIISTGSDLYSNFDQQRSSNC